MEEYPLSRAFLVLLDSLCSAAPLPRALGAGTRPPGLDPYVEHALQRLALPAPHRPYARSEEKWQVRFMYPSNDCKKIIFCFSKIELTSTT